MSWPVEKLGDICSLITDGKHGDCKNEEGSDYYFISAKDVKDGVINYEKARQIVETDFRETHRRTDLNPGDVLITNSGTIGRLAIANDSERTSRTTFQKSVAILKPIREKITSRYLYYALEHNKRALINTAGGAAQKNLLLGELRRFEIDVPSIKDQESLCSYLSTYDDLIENNNRRIELLEESARQLYKEWFVRFRFPGHEHVNMIDGVPEGWVVKPLSKIAGLTMGQSPKSEFYNIEGNGIPFHQGVTKFGFRYVEHKTFCTKPTRLSLAEDILFSVRAPVGRINITNDVIALGRGLAAIRSIEGFQSFLFYALKSYFFKEDMIGGGAIYASVTKKDLENQELLIPLNSLLVEFDEFASDVDQQILKLHKMNVNLTKARDLLLPKLMSGQIAI